MDEWIDRIDAELSRLRDTEASIRYAMDVQGHLDAQALSQCSARRREILWAAAKDAKAHMANCTGKSRRKYALLLNAAHLSLLDDEPEVSRIRNDLESQLYDFLPTIDGTAVTYSQRAALLTTSDDPLKRRIAHESIKPFLESIEPHCRRFLKAANKAAVQLGMENYATAKMSYQELDMTAFRRLSDQVRRAWAPRWRRLLARRQQHSPVPVEAWDIRHFLHRELEAMDGAVQFKDDVVAVVADTLAMAGLDFATLPITISLRPVPHTGAVHALKVGADIQVVLREGTTFSRLGAWSTLFHEIGHALYYCFAPKNTSLLLDDRIAREGLAEVWARLIETPEWLRHFAGCASEKGQRLLELQRDSSVLMALECLRDTLFEIELFANPDASFERTWRQATEDVFGIADSTGVYSEHIGMYPLDMKDYVYARVIADAVVAELRSTVGDDLLSPATLQRVVDRYYGKWNLEPWHVRLPCCLEADE